MGTGSVGWSAGESLPCFSQASVFRIQEGHRGQLGNSTNAPFMTLILLVVAATSQVYTLLHNTHQPPKACAVAAGTLGCIGG